ncbi:MAG: hypothetical protein AVO35_00665 [Candidatus Aegiribacteria sp. MLS_C]|nr:MAG: hypothetical protein AVO35_00665 [Candidatus Aegiribacteria sp. MLS_C]
MELAGRFEELDRIRQAARRLLDPLVGLLARLGIGPFSVTSAGLILTAAAAVLVWYGSYIPGAALLIAGSILDAVDGELARRKGIVSRAGAVFDSSSDRIGELLVFGAMLAGKAGAEHASMVYLVPAAIGGSFMVSYVRARAEGVNLSCSVGIFTRTERLVLLITGLAGAGVWGGGILVVLLSVLAAGTWVTAVQRFAKVIKDGRGVSLNRE